jgi:hypothetical protein
MNSTGLKQSSLGIFYMPLVTKSRRVVHPHIDPACLAGHVSSVQMPGGHNWLWQGETFSPEICGRETCTICAQLEEAPL